MLDDGLHALLGVPDVLLHALSGVHYLFFSVLCVVYLSLVLCLLDFILRFSLFEGPKQLLSYLCNFCLSIV